MCISATLWAGIELELIGKMIRDVQVKLWIILYDIRLVGIQLFYTIDL